MTFSLTALALVVASSIGWSGFDVLRKVMVERVPPLPLLFVLTLGQVPLFGVWWVLQPAGIEPRYWLPAFISVLLNAVANVSLIVAMKWSPLHLTIPLLSLIPALTTLLAIPLLGELPGPRQWTGILLVVAGALWLNLAGGIRTKGLGSFLAALLHEKGSLLMLVVALAWSLTLPLDKIAMRAAGAAFHGFFLALGVSAGVLLAMALRGETKRVEEVRHAPGLAVLAVVVSFLALGFQLLAMQIVWVSLVETLKRGIGNLMALIWGRYLLAETVTGGSVGAVLLMAVGVALILI